MRYFGIVRDAQKSFCKSRSSLQSFMSLSFAVYHQVYLEHPITISKVFKACTVLVSLLYLLHTVSALVCFWYMITLNRRIAF